MKVESSLIRHSETVTHAKELTVKHRKRALRVIVHLLTVLCAMAFMAAHASALWLENTGTGLKAITANKELEISAHGEGRLFVAQETDLEIFCSVIENNGSELLTGTSEGRAFVVFKTCETWQNGANISKNCTPVKPMIASAKAKLILHGTKNYILFEPIVAGGILIKVKFPESCSLPEINNVRGTLVTECGKLQAGAVVGVDCATSGITVFVLTVNEALFTSDKLTYGTKSAVLSGAAEVALTSFHEWCGHV